MIKLLLFIGCCLFANCSATGGGSGPQVDSCQEEAKAVSEAGEADNKPPPPGDIKVHEHTLKNGLRIVVVPVDSNGQIYFGVLYGVGSVDDPANKLGISHFLEHMMFNGTKNVSKTRLRYFLDKYHVYSGANTNLDCTLYYGAIRKELLYLSLKIEADRMANLTIDKQEFAREKKVIMEEAGLDNLDPINKYMNDAVPRTLYLYSQYASSVIGTTHTIESITPKALMKHYRKYYVPNNATLIFVGSIEKDEAVQLAEKYFGHIKSSSPLRRRVIPEPLNTGISYFIEHSIPEIKTQTLQIFYSLDKGIFATSKDIYAVQFMTGILSGPYGATKLMVDEKNLICGGGIDLSLNRGNKTFLCISLSLREGRDRRVVEKECLEIIRNYKQFLTKELLQMEKEKDAIGFNFTTDSPQGVFWQIVGMVNVGRSMDDVSNRRKIIESITLEDLINMAETIFKDENITHMVYLHPPEIRRWGY
jgi:zinc protease